MSDRAWFEDVVRRWAENRCESAADEMTCVLCHRAGSFLGPCRQQRAVPCSLQSGGLSAYRPPRTTQYASSVNALSPAPHRLSPLLVCHWWLVEQIIKTYSMSAINFSKIHPILGCWLPRYAPYAALCRRHALRAGEGGAAGATQHQAEPQWPEQETHYSLPAWQCCTVSDTAAVA